MRRAFDTVRQAPWLLEAMGGGFASEQARSGDVSLVYRLKNPTVTAFLKLAPDLGKEREKLEWLRSWLPVPRILGFTTH